MQTTDLIIYTTLHFYSLLLSGLKDWAVWTVETPSYKEGPEVLNQCLHNFRDC